MPHCDHYCRWVPIQTWWHSLTNQEVLGKSTREIQLQKKKILQLHFPLCLISLMSKSIAHWWISLKVTLLQYLMMGAIYFFDWSEINHIIQKSCHIWQQKHIQISFHINGQSVTVSSLAFNFPLSLQYLKCVGFPYSIKTEKTV